MVRECLDFDLVEGATRITILLFEDWDMWRLITAKLHRVLLGAAKAFSGVKPALDWQPGLDLVDNVPAAMTCLRQLVQSLPRELFRSAKAYDNMLWILAV
jgi:hypothetical protein